MKSFHQEKDESHLFGHDHEHVLNGPTITPSEPLLGTAPQTDPTIVEQDDAAKISTDTAAKELSLTISKIKYQLKAIEASLVESEIDLECLREEAGVLGRKVQRIEDTDWQGTLSGDDPMAFNEYMHLKAEFMRLVKEYVIEQAKFKVDQSKANIKKERLNIMLQSKEQELFGLNKAIQEQKPRTDPNAVNSVLF